MLYFANRNYGTGITNIKKSYLKDGYLNTRYEKDPLKLKRANDKIQAREKLIDEVIHDGYLLGIKDYPPFIQCELQKREEAQRFKVAARNLSVAETFNKYLESIDGAKEICDGTKERYYRIKSRLCEFEEEVIKVPMSGLNLIWDQAIFLGGRLY